MNTLFGAQIETSTACNGKCVFCPRGKLKEHGTMDDEVFNKIILDLQGFPALAMVNIQGNAGEPFCDPKFLDRLEYARQALPNASLEFYTNGSLLTEPIVDRLAKVNDLRVNVSLNGGPETRKKYTGLDDYWHVVRMMQYMRHKGIPTRASMVAYREISLGEMQDFVESGGLAIQYQSWAGQQYPYERKRWTSCPRAMHNIYIRFNGDVTLCCFDIFGLTSQGNAKVQTLKEIWLGPVRREYVLMHRQGRGCEMDFCKSCTEG